MLLNDSQKANLEDKLAQATDMKESKFVKILEEVKPETYADIYVTDGTGPNAGFTRPIYIHGTYHIAFYYTYLDQQNRKYGTVNQENESPHIMIFGRNTFTSKHGSLEPDEYLILQADNHLFFCFPVIIGIHLLLVLVDLCFWRSGTKAT